MVTFYSNYLKVVFAPEDLGEMSEAILRSNCYTVQHFHYESKRLRDNNSGMDVHAEDSTLMDITIRINTPNCGKQLLEQMQDIEPHAYTLLFNATFKPTGRLEDYDDAIVATGYIINIEEAFDTPQQPEQQEQMLMHIQLLLNTITFVGMDNNLVFNV